MDEKIKNTILSKIESKTEKIFNNLEQSSLHDLVQELDIYHAELKAQNEELKENEQLLMASQEELYRFFNDAPIIYIVMDKNYNITRYNLLANNTFRFLNRFQNKFTSIIHTKELQLFLKWLNNDISSITLTLRTKDNYKKFNVLKHSVKVLNEEIQYMLALNDVDEEYKLKEMLKEEAQRYKSLMDVAKESEEKAIHAQEQLELVNEELKLAYESKSEFLANMSHEIRTPLSGIIGITDIILENNTLSENDKNNLEIVKTSSYKLKNIINDILDFSKIQSGKFKIIFKEFSLKILIADIENLFAAQIINKDLKFNVVIDEKVEDILIGDELRISQVLTNLVGNSVKFTDHGTISLKVSKIRKYGNNIKLKFEVKDTGIGMSEKVQESLFESFTQGELSNTKNFKGSGLGLTISKSLIELMNGELDFISFEGVGSTFFFTLEFKFMKKGKNVLIPKIETVSVKKGTKVLVAEDSEVNQIIIKQILEKIGFDIDMVINGVEAINFAKKNSYSMIFMDIQMPEMDGYEATQRIRLFNKEIPIIALSAAVLQEDINKSLEIGMNYHIGKPIERNELYMLINEILNSKLKNIKGDDTNTNKSDFDDLIEHFGEKVTVEVLTIFIKQYQDFAKLLKNPNNIVFKNFIHKLKGSCGNLNFTYLYKLCEDIENTNKDEQLNLIEKLIKEMNEIEIKINNYIKNVQG